MLGSAALETTLGSLDEAKPKGALKSAEVTRVRFGERVSLHRATAATLGFDCLLLLATGLLPLQFSGEVRNGVTEAALEKMQVVFLSLAIFLVIQRVLGGYRSKHLLRGSHSMRRLVLSLFIVFSFLILLGAATKVTQTYSRIWFFTWMASSLALLPLARAMVLGRLRRELATGSYVYRALSLAYLCAPLHPAAIARMTHGTSQALEPKILANVRDFQAIEKYIRDEEIEEVYITVAWEDAPKVFEGLKAIQHLSANIYVMPTLGSGDLSLIGARLRGGGLQVHVLDRPIEGWEISAKRFSDVAIALTALFVFAPVMVVTALATKLSSRGPILFRQTRKGFNGRHFELLKFRSMCASRTDKDAERQTSRGDDRVTMVGRFIRKTSIDELPQLINVVRGDMSIVGPRPHALRTTAEGRELDEAVGNYAWRHRVKPGMTGWAQVNGLRGELDTVEKLRLRVEYDTQYINKWSLAFDVWILLKTVSLIFRDSRAY
jgi:Undecaprenyl-phosphate glucose phosphotransferase